MGEGIDGAGDREIDSTGTRFTEAERRAQIISATIETIARHGLGRSLFAQIADQAALSSTGLISYHFADREALIEQVVTQIHVAMAEAVRARVAQESTAVGALRAFIKGSVAFYAGNRTHTVALLRIMSAAREAGRRTGAAELARAAELGELRELLLRGQRRGEFRWFSPVVMAVTIRQALDGLLALLRGEPDLDLDGYAHELVAIFDLATRQDTDVPGSRFGMSAPATAPGAGRANQKP